MSLFSPYVLGDLRLANRMVMAPMTRCRAIGVNVPGPLSVLYYVQRASAGLIITEGSQVSPQGVGFFRTPGIYSDAQVTGWKEVTSAVHRAGGKMFLQLWHVGRMSHPDYLSGSLPVAPSALPVNETIHTPAGKKFIPVPHALGLTEILKIVREFQDAAARAKEAGFDGVEIHGANGYLLDQFLRDGSNHRTDRYGGSLANRARLPVEIAEAVVAVWGAKKVGYRISPHFNLHAMSDTHPRETFGHLADRLSKLGIAYIHLVEPVGGKLGAVTPDAQMAPLIRKKFDGTLILNGGYDKERATRVIEDGLADLVAFGTPFLANPDLPERFMRDAPLNREDMATFYTGEEKGYTDYPVLGG
ncbi:alkene reductase [Methanoregula sp.]|uniref:alkene reductase n=1 Tax=Methanoregula sp. TaxID=2052170 RepID=UPI002BD1FF11|nr:alkene reductase [Methanoregula sp.]HVP96102.1 alkene reductase [Methanoregula sp.]